MRAWTVCFLLLATALLSACSATGPLYQPPPAAPPGHATVVIYREWFNRGSVWRQHWFIDGEEKASLYGNGYTHFVVPAGTHVLSSFKDPANASLKLDGYFAAGETYFFKYDIISRQGLRYQHLVRMPADTATEERKVYRLDQAPLATGE